MAIQGSKSVTTSGTRVQLVASTTEALGRCCARVTITGNTANTNKIYIGTASVSTTAFGESLEADQSTTIGSGGNGNSVDLANIWLDADTNGEGVKFYGEQV